MPLKSGVSFSYQPLSFLKISLTAFKVKYSRGSSFWPRIPVLWIPMWECLPPYPPIHLSHPAFPTSPPLPSFSFSLRVLQAPTLTPALEQQQQPRSHVPTGLALSVLGCSPGSSDLPSAWPSACLQPAFSLGCGHSPCTHLRELSIGAQGPEG